MIGS
ncbi:hypothetical protein EC940618_0296, partial [Escherichia coli 94.0618]|jgi:hypothetical protein